MTYLWLHFSFGRMMRLLFGEVGNVGEEGKVGIVGKEGNVGLTGDVGIGILECFPSSAVAVEFDGN